MYVKRSLLGHSWWNCHLLLRPRKVTSVSLREPQQMSLPSHVSWWVIVPGWGQYCEYLSMLWWLIWREEWQLAAHKNYAVYPQRLSLEQLQMDLLTDWVVVLCPTQQKIGHFQDVPQANLLDWYGKTKANTTRMWANAQPDGRPAEHRWRPLFNAPKFGWRPLLDAVQ